MPRVLKVVKDDLHVEANKIDNIHIYYKCPFCRKIHNHGSGGDLSNREEIRISHCNIHRGSVFINVTDFTLRKKKI